MRFTTLAATGLAALALLFLAAGCGVETTLASDGGLRPDAGAPADGGVTQDGGLLQDGGAPATSLEGTLACGAMTCTSGQLCLSRASGVDGGGAPVPFCQDAPPGCTDLRDCDDQSSCTATPPTCAQTACGPTPPHQVRGRVVHCMGQ